MAPSRPHVLLAGYYHHQNTGDDLLLRAGLQLLTGTAEVHVLSETALDVQVPRVRRALLPWLRWADHLVLFGGEVLNPYFLDRLVDTAALAREVRRTPLRFHAVGVSSDCAYGTLAPYLDLFSTFLARNSVDQAFWNLRSTGRLNPQTLETWLSVGSGGDLPMHPAPPDAAFLLAPKLRLAASARSVTGDAGDAPVALFPCAIHGAQEHAACLAIGRHALAQGRRVVLAAMCRGTGEDDATEVLALAHALGAGPRVQCITEQRQLLDQLSSFRAIYSSRYHALILALVHGIPFIALRETPKVKNLLRDSGVAPGHRWATHQGDAATAATWLEQHDRPLRRSLLALATELHHEAASRYQAWAADLRQAPVVQTQYYHASPAKLTRCLTPLLTSAQARGATSPDAVANVLLRLLLGITGGTWHWGLSQRIAALGPLPPANLLEALTPDLLYLVGRAQGIGSLALQAQLLVLHQLPLVPRRPRAINIHYQDQSDSRGLHRFGWQAVVEAIEATPFITLDPQAPCCDLYVDRTFHWDRDVGVATGALPYTQPWIGFVHHTCLEGYTEHNTAALFRDPVFLASLATCRGLCTLSRSLQQAVQDLVIAANHAVPVHHLYHPLTEIAEGFRFSFEQFLATRRLVQIGAWYRDISSIFNLPLLAGPGRLTIQRAALQGPHMEGYYRPYIETADDGGICRGVCRGICRGDGPIVGPVDPAVNPVAPVAAPVEIIGPLDDEEYDLLMQNSVVFLCLFDASAVNTLLECIRFKTPVLVNPLPAVVEYLGPHYPLYYDTLEEAAAKAQDEAQLRLGWQYLLNYDDGFLGMPRFLQRLQSLAADL